MIVLVAVGAMNIAVMAAFAAVTLIEKIWRYGRPFAIAVGITLIVLAALALFGPRLLPGLQPTTPMSDQMLAQTPTNVAQSGNALAPEEVVRGSLSAAEEGSEHFRQQEAARDEETIVTRAVPRRQL